MGFNMGGGSGNGEMLKKISTLENDISVERSRINQLTTLEEGSTTGDAELIDARVDVNGITHPNVGEAIRGQIESVNVDIAEIDECFDKVLLSNNILPPDTESGRWNPDADRPVKIDSSSYQRSPETIPFKSGETYLYFYSNAMTGNTSDLVQIIYLNAEGYKLGSVSYRFGTLKQGSGAIPDGATCFVASIYDASGNGTTLADICVSYSVLSDGYEAYQSKKVIKSENISDEVMKQIQQNTDAISQEINDRTEADAVLEESIAKNIKDISEIKEYHPLAGKTIVNFGDSIFGMFQDTSAKDASISSMLAKLTGATVYNCGFSGCKMAYYTGTDHQLFSMAKLADAIVSGDYSAQEEAMNNWTSATQAAKTSFETLKTIDFNNVNIITIAYGANDYMVNIDLDSETNPTDIYKFGSALRYSIETILTAYPHIRIFICSPTYRFWMDSSYAFTEDSDSRVNADGNLLSAYVEKVKDVASQYHLPCIDNYFELGLNKLTRSKYFDAQDGTHPNLDGRYLIARHIAQKLF